MNIRIKRKIKKSHTKLVLTLILCFCAILLKFTYNNSFANNLFSTMLYGISNQDIRLEINPVIVSITTISSITTVSSIEEEKFDEEKVIKAIDKYLGGLLKNKGIVFYKSGKKHHSNPMMLAAISIHETNNGNPWQYIKGKKLPSLLVTCNNVCGMNKRTGFESKGRYAKYNSIDQSIDDMAYWTKFYYIDILKLNSIDKIAKVYAPLNDYQNNTMGMSNESWPGSVTEKYKKILDDSK